MSTSFYEVVVVGASVEALLCATLLSKRGFRVLLVGQGNHAPYYRVGPYTFPRVPMDDSACDSPIAHRILEELALQPLFRRASRPVSPGLQLATPHHRFDIENEIERVEAEIDREFGRLRRPILDVHLRALQLSKAFDDLLDESFPWPPQGLWERYLFRRLLRRAPFDRLGMAGALASELPRHHPFALALKLPFFFGANAATTLPSDLGLARHYAQRVQRAWTPQTSLSWLHDTLLERLLAQGSEWRPKEKITKILSHGPRVRGIVLEHAGDEIGCNHIVYGASTESLEAILRASAIDGAELEDRRVERRRYLLNLGVAAEALPQALAVETYAIEDAASAFSPLGAMRLRTYPGPEDSLRVLSLEVSVAGREDEHSPLWSEMRERLLARLPSIVPFVETQLKVIDSPHDGLAPSSPAPEQNLELSDPWNRGIAFAPRIYADAGENLLGIASHRPTMPLRSLHLCNPQIFAGMGAEGSFLTAWACARQITRADRSRETLRRGRWMNASA